MFEKASKLKLRFSTNRGRMSTEDLWDLPLSSDNQPSLDTIAKSLNRQIKACEESFVSKKSVDDAILSLKFDIVKYVITTKLAEKNLSEKRAIMTSKRQHLLAIIADKEESKLKDQSIDELRVMLDEIEVE